MGLILPYGPFELTTKNINAYVARSPGAYILTRQNTPTMFYVNYVGRSDSDLVSRLTDHANAGRYSHFKYVYASGADEAFALECRLFHDYGEERSLDNKCHPDRPNGLASLLYNKCGHCKLFG